MGEPIYQQRGALVPNNEGFLHEHLVYSRPEKGEILAKEHHGLRPAQGRGPFRRSPYDKRYKWFILEELALGHFVEREIEAKYLAETEEDLEEKRKRGLEPAERSKDEMSGPLTIEDSTNQSESGTTGSDQNMNDGYESDVTTTTAKAYRKGEVWEERGSITPCPSPTLSAITGTDYGTFQEDLERTERTVRMVKEQLKKADERDEEKDIDMRDGWMADIDENKWQQLTAEAAIKARESGMTGMESEIRVALEHEVKQAKRKRALGDIDGGLKAENQGKGQPRRILANTKRAIIDKVVTGLLASKHATGVNQNPKGKGKAIPTRTPEPGESAGKQKTMEERMLAMERRMGSADWEIRELKKTVNYWKDRCLHSENRPNTQHPQPRRNDIGNDRMPSTSPATSSNRVPLSYASAAKSPLPQWQKVESREEVARKKAREENTRRKIQKEKEDEEKSQRIVVIDMGKNPIAGKSASQSELIQKATEMGVDKEAIEAVNTTVNGNLRVVVKPQVEAKAIVTQLANKQVGARTLENWAGIVVGGWSRNEWADKMGELKEVFEKAWGVQLMKEPRWLTHDKTIGPGKNIQSVVAHVAKTSDRERILTNRKFVMQDNEGYAVHKGQDGYGQWMREFVKNGMTSEKAHCSKCDGTGHKWWECKGQKKCGHCGEGHSSWEHVTCGAKGDWNGAQEMRVEGVRIVQQNCNKSTIVMQNLMDIGKSVDVLAIQEPWIGDKNRKRKKVEMTVDIGGGQITVGHNGYDIIFRQGGQEQKSRVMWMVRKDSGMKWTVRDDLWNHCDASILDIQMKGGMCLRIVNVYNQDHKERKGWCMEEFPYGLGVKTDLLLLGDFNAKGALWDTKSKSVREEMIMEVVEREELVLLNEKDRHTWMRGGKQSILDLTWCAINMERRCNWKIIEDTDIGSDHATIQIDYLQSAERVMNPMGKRWDIKKADWELVRASIQSAMELRELAWEEAVENQQTENIARLLEEVVQEGMEKGIPQAKMTWRSKKWFDEEVREKRKEVSQCKRWKKQTGGLVEEKAVIWKKKRNELFRMIRKKKVEMWDKFIQDAKSQKEAWTVWRTLNQRIYTKTPTITNGTGQLARSFEEKEELFRKALFPEAPTRDQIRDPPATKENEISISEKEIVEAIESQGSLKAPGADGILSKVLKEAGSEFHEWMREGMEVMVRKGEHPKQWRRAIGAIIPKPSKGDYTTPRSYRPISLLSTIGKTLEKVVEGKITKHMESKKKLHDMQWGGRRGRGAEECVEWTLEWVKEKQAEGKKVAIIAADIDQAFPNVARIRLGNRLRKAGIDESLATWTESFMSEREVKLRFDGREGEWAKMDTGIPQGSPISPLLFNTYIAPLLEQLQKYIETQLPNDAITPTFIDDVTIVVAGDSWEEVIERAEELLVEAYNWAAENDVKFAKDKLEWIRLGNIEEKEKEYLWMPEGGSKEESEVMRWLGVWLDRKLLFKEHVSIKIKKGERVAAGMFRLAKGERGCRVGNLRRMYVGCARSVMDYGSRVWWKGQKGLAEKMDKAEEKAMRRLGGHFRTAPGGAIRVENDLIPTELRLNERQKRITIRTMKKTGDHPMRVMAEKEISIRQEKENWTGGRRRKSRVLSGVKRGIEVIDGEIKGRWRKVEKWKMKEKESEWEERVRKELEIKIGSSNEEGIEEQKKRKEEEGEVIMYTDGSKRNEKVRVGVTRIGWNGKVVWKRSYGMGREMEIMDAEMVGIRKAVNQGVKECRKEKAICLVIWTDSQEAMKRVKKREGGAGEMMARRIRWDIDLAKEEGIRISFEWVKAHAGIIGNEQADQLAKEGCTKPADPEAFISISYLEAKARSDTIEEWQKQWKDTSNKGSRYGLDPKRRKITRFAAHDREAPVILSRLRTEHIWVHEYAKRFQKRENDECECGKGVQDVKHVLTECMFSLDAREEAMEELGGELSIALLLYTSEGARWGVEIWREFKRVSRGVNGEHERENEEIEWGYGDLEK